MLYLAAALYAVVFWILGYKNPRIPLLLICTLAPLQTDVSGGGPLRFSITEINVLLTVPLLLFRKRRKITLGPLTFSIAFYLLISLGCTLMNWRATSLVCLIQMALYLVVIVLIFYALPKNELDYRLALDGFIFMGVALALTILFKRSGYVWGLHKNGTGSSLAAAVIVCVEMWFAAAGTRKRLLAGALVIMAAGLFFTLSRGAWLGSLVGLSILVAMRGQFRLLLKLGLTLVPLVALCWAYLPQSSQEYTTGFSKEDNFNIKMRYESVDLAVSIFKSSPIIGRGVGLRKEYDATNLALCTLAETGVVGLFALIVLHAGIFRLSWKTQKNMARTSTLYSGVALGSALVFSRLLHGMVDHYWGRGPNTIVWAAVGMALYGHHVKRKYLIQKRREALQAAGVTSAPPIPAGNANGSTLLTS